jgi:hypothetical protein
MKSAVDTVVLIVFFGILAATWWMGWKTMRWLWHAAGRLFSGGEDYNTADFWTGPGARGIFTVDRSGTARIVFRPGGGEQPPWEQPVWCSPGKSGRGWMADLSLHTAAVNAAHFQRLENWAALRAIEKVNDDLQREGRSPARTYLLFQWGDSYPDLNDEFPNPRPVPDLPPGAFRQRIQDEYQQQWQQRRKAKV